MSGYENFYHFFDKFKKNTKEEYLIIENILNILPINENSTVLDIGSSNGVISSGIQKNIKLISLVDIDETNIPENFNFIRSEWEKAELKDKFDIVLASHVWGHFFYTKTQKNALMKMEKAVKRGGHLILVFNSNDGFLSDLISFVEENNIDSQYDQFDEKMLKGYEFQARRFEVVLCAESFDELSNYMQVLFVMSDINFLNVKDKFNFFLQKHLSEPVLRFNQIVVRIDL